MANAVRPPFRAPVERQTKLTFSPVAHDDVLRSAHHAAIATRRSSKGSPLLVLGDDDDKAVKQPAHTSRKRPATALIDATRPTKITVTQPHGELLRVTNGVSAPRPGSAGRLDKRSLRSHDGGSRLKSDLATYFSSYDDIIAGVPKQAEFLDWDTPIYIVDEPPKSKTPVPVSPSSSRASRSPTRSRKRKASTPAPAACNPALPPTQSSTTFQVLDYTTIAKAVQHDHAEDPLADAIFFTQHRRAERKEKQLRNIEKERAMHEKVQLERLLDGLQGPDWLKVMGITGVTDGERKDWEPKRDFFVKEVEALVDKFRVWKEEEKRLRAEKEAALAAHDEDDENEVSESSEDNIIVNGQIPRPAEHRSRDSKPSVPRKPPRPQGFLLPFIPPEPAVPFQSFYSKPHLRAAALGKHRHGRNATAFGLPIPDFEEHEFEVPEEFVDPQFLRDNARQRRRRKRESGANPSSTTQ